MEIIISTSVKADENVARASDYIGTDLSGAPIQQSFACKAWYNLTQNQPFQYMTFRCDPDLRWQHGLRYRALHPERGLRDRGGARRRLQ